MQSLIQFDGALAPRSPAHHLSSRRSSRCALSALAATLCLLAAPQAMSATYRWSGTSNRVYIEGTGTATLTELQAAVPVAPVVLVDPANKIWMVSANIIINGGATLALHGSAVGGDVNELRLKSDNTTGGFIYVSAEPGKIDIDSTNIRSWNSATNAVDSEYQTFGRAFIRVRSMLATDGVTALESRMDIKNSQISFLGYDAAESYGLVWKVTGDPGPTFDLYNKVNVYGDIQNSHIHHNFYGVYTFGLAGGQWLNNEIDHNVGYGFDPHDDSDDLLIDGNNVHENGYHGIIASKRCDHVVITNNHSWGNAECGIMLHRSSNHGTIDSNVSENNGDCGVALFATGDTLVSNNTLLNNGNAGIRLSLGANSNTVDHNEMGGSAKYGIYFYHGSDTPEPGSDGRNRDNVFTNNNVHDSAADGMKITDSDDNTFSGNTFTANGTTMTVETTTNTRFSGNSVPAGVVFNISGTPSVPSVVKFSQQPQLMLQLDSGGSAQLSDAGNRILDTAFALFTTAAATGGGGSLLDLDPTNFSGSSVVYTRPFVATPTIGTVKVNPQIWRTTGDHAKAFQAKISDATARVDYSVGDLVPAASYDVFRGTAKIYTRIADGAGRIAFSVKPGSVLTRSYSVKPTP